MQISNDDKNTWDDSEQTKNVLTYFFTVTYSFISEFFYNFAQNFRNSMKILVTGASGFIGSYIVEEALKRGMDTWAAMRSSSSKQFLKDERIHFIELNLDDQKQLEQQLSGHQFDYVVHAAGVTKCLNKADFFRINTQGTKHLVRALIALNMPIKKFVYISSLSVFGAIHEEQPYVEIKETDQPHPNTEYGRSKREAERWLNLYFSGSAPDFLPPLLLRGTAFQRMVWEFLLAIPYGGTVTYGEIADAVARMMGKPRMSAQAVGGAVGRNPVSIIVPCHRVIGADGSLTGYARGVERKRYLLQLEQNRK
jgi:O-6-methylguanine DNA methyltransferase